jgi:PelA/Pel-15E family pectate lyase
MKTGALIAILACLIHTAFTFAQDKPSDLSSKSWQHVATKMPTEWYGSAEAKSVAENVLMAQKEIGGWEKNKPYHHPFSESEKNHYLNDKKEIGATLDNGSTITELKFLAKMYSQTNEEQYKQAFEKGLNYIFISQYENGGWPQFFPVRKGSTSYSGHITYNDNSMVNTMQFLKGIYSGDKEFSALNLKKDEKVKAQKAFDKGVACILKTQIEVNGKPTVWCAQHDEVTLAPANARSYELASFSGAESVGIVLLLMELNNPSKEIIASVESAVKWFDTHKIEGIRLNSFVNSDGLKDLEVVTDESAPTLWARFYDLETEKPYFCDRDGIKKETFAEMGHNRRNGYSWYTTVPEKLLSKYPEWKKNLNKNE